MATVLQTTSIVIIGITLDDNNSKASSVMENLWKAYQKNYYYAANISWQMVMQSIQFLYEISYNDNERTIIHEQNTFVGR